MAILDDYLKDPESAEAFKKENYKMNASEELLDLYADFGLSGLLEGVREIIIALWHNRNRHKLINHINEQRNRMEAK